MSERPLVLTPGVRRQGDRYEFPGLPVSILAGDGMRERLLMAGFASEGRWPRDAGITRALQPRWRARVLARTVPVAAAQCGWHFGLSSWPWLMLAGTGMLLGGSGWMGSWGVIAQAGLLVLLATIVHEAGHAVIFRALAGPAPPALLVGRGLLMHLVRPVLTPRRDLAVIVAGPLAPTVAGLLAAPLLVHQPYAGLVWTVVAVVHALALLLPIGDGANLRAWWRGQVTVRRGPAHVPGRPPSAAWSPRAASSDGSSEP